LVVTKEKHPILVGVFPDYAFLVFYSFIFNSKLKTNWSKGAQTSVNCVVLFGTENILSCRVCLYIQNNFYNKITLKEIAALNYLTESNFCKFFQKATRKTYSDYLNEIRINEAYRLLVRSEKTISQTSYDFGFETLSYFTSVFLNKKSITPSTYKNRSCALYFL